MFADISEDNKILPQNGNLPCENHQITIFTTTSSQCADDSEQVTTDCVKQKWRARPSTPFRQPKLSLLVDELQQNNTNSLTVNNNALGNENLSTSNNNAHNDENLSTSDNNAYNNELSTSFLSLSGVSAAGNTDDSNLKQANTPRKPMLVNRSSLAKSPDINEVKSVKFQQLDDCPGSNGFTNTGKKNKVWPVNSETTDIVTCKPQSVPTVISNTCFGWWRQSRGRSCEIQKTQPSNEDNSKKSDSCENDDAHSTSHRSGLCRCSDLSTQSGRRNHAMLIMLMSVIPVMALLIQNSINLSEHSSQLQLHKSMKQRILFSVETGNVIHRTQIERGMTALYISSRGKTEIKDDLLQAYTETDKAIERLTYWIVEPGYDHLKSIQSYHAWIQQFRDEVLAWPADNVTISEVISFYSDDNAVITRWVGSSIQQSKSGDLWKTLVGYYMLILSKEQAGVERALGSTFYAQGGFDDKQMLTYMERKILGVTYLDRCKDYSLSITTFLTTKFIGQETDLSVKRMREDIMQNALNGSEVVMGSYWFWNMTKYINVLKWADKSKASEQEADSDTSGSITSRDDRKQSRRVYIQGNTQSILEIHCSQPSLCRRS